MRWAEAYLMDKKGIVFSRRKVTRPAFPGSDHDELSIREFEIQHASGKFSWHWQAHGFNYSIDVKYSSQVAAGQIVVVNGSREHTKQLEHHEHIRVVEVVVSPDELQARLINRGRESGEKIAERLKRNHLFTELNVHYSIVNDGELAESGKAFADYLEAVCLSSSNTAK